MGIHFTEDELELLCCNARARKHPSKQPGKYLVRAIYLPSDDFYINSGGVSRPTNSAKYIMNLSLTLK